MRKPFVPTDEEILDYNPWGDDDSPYRVLSNKMVVTRKPHDCTICFEGIASGTRVRAQSEVLDGKCMTFRFCTLCCRAMAKATTSSESCDHGRWMEHRTSLGIKNAEAKRKAAA